MTSPLGFSQHSSGYWMKSSDQSGPYSYDGTSTTLITATPGSPFTYPTNSTALQSSSGNVANANAVATLAASASLYTYCTGFEITSSGATASSIVSATLTGLLGGTATYTYSSVAGALLGNAPLIVTFQLPLISIAQNTAIVLTLPALGLGNTNATVTIHGFNR